MDWSKGYSARYYISILDKATLRDVKRIELTGGSIKRSISDLRASADLDCVDYQSNVEQYIRVWLDAKQDGTSSHTALFTGIATSPSKSIKGRYVTNTLECYSLLKVAQDILLPRGWYIPAEMNAGKAIKRLLGVVGTEVVIDESTKQTPNLEQAIIAEDGENNLSMVDKILDTINWRMRMDGMGVITIEPYASDYSEIFGALNNDILETNVSVSYDWFNCPNVFRAIMDDQVAIARDDSPDSVYSTVNRGREIWMEEADCALSDDMTIAEYAARALESAQQVATNISYDRRFMPDIYPTDVIGLNYPAQNLVGKYMVTDQTITLGYNAKTAEEVIQI